MNVINMEEHMDNFHVLIAYIFGYVKLYDKLYRETSPHVIHL